MIAHRNEQTDLLTLYDGDLPTENQPRYRRFEGGIGWRDPTGQGPYALNWLVVIGEQEDGVYRIFQEASGSIFALGKAAIAAKDRFLIERFWTDASEVHAESVNYLRSSDQESGVDGLCCYESHGTNLITKQPVWALPESHWPHFRSRATLAAICDTPADIKVDLVGGLDMLKTLNAQKRLVVQYECHETGFLVPHKPPFDKIFKHPAFLALIWCLGMMQRTKDRPVIAQENGGEPWYTNRDHW